MKHILVVGSGPAGLAAAEALADRGVAVTLLTMGHILGGKACSWELKDGRTLEHGQHVMLGFYKQMRALIRRAGVDPLATAVSNEGRYTIFEDRDDRSHELHLGRSTPGTLVDGLRYSGWTLAEKAGLAQLMARTMPRIIAGVPESWDDICLTAWCLERGFPASAVASNAFRASREAQLNWPGEISAYTMLKTIKVAGRDYTSAEARIPAGGMSAIWWKPIAARIEALGGQIVRYQKLTRIVHRDSRLTGLAFAVPMPHAPEHPHTLTAVPVQPGSERVRTDFDAAILAIPHDSLTEIMDDETAAIPGLCGVKRLRSVPPLGMHVWHSEMPRPRHNNIVAGLPPPLGFVVNNKPIYPSYRDDPMFGACLHFVGQESCFEHLDDLQLLERAMAALRKVDGYEMMTLDGVLDWRVVRNRAPHKRYWNAEPGSLALKPTPQTPIKGLYLAGDWVRSELDFPCMETAIRSGRQAADLVMRDLRRRAS